MAKCIEQLVNTFLAEQVNYHSITNKTFPHTQKEYPSIWLFAQQKHRSTSIPKDALSTKFHTTFCSIYGNILEQCIL